MTAVPSSDRAARGLLCFGFLAAWWIAYFPLPFPEFYKEWIFAISLGLCAVMLGPVAQPRALLRQPMVLAALATAAVLLVQAAAMEGAWPKGLQMAAYAAFFAVTVLVGRTLAQQRPGNSLEWLALCILAAALGSCFFGALQLNWIDFPFPLVAPRSLSRITANIAQANHFADLLWLGVAATAYLHARRRLGTPTAALAVVLLLAFSLFSGSRMVWVYAGLVGLLGAVMLARRPAPEARRFALACLAVVAVFALLVPLLSASGVYELFGIRGSGERAVSASGQGSNRLRLWFWMAGLDAAATHPLFGVGAGHYVGHAHLLSMGRPDAPAGAADTNAHNVFIHVAAELGIPLALFVAGCVLVWLLQAWRRAARSLDALAVLAMAGVVLVHANLEYPLWFAYFLGLLGLLVGHLPDAPESAAADALAVPANSRLGQFAGAMVMLVAVLAYQQFKPLENAMQQVVGQVGFGAAPQQDETLVTTLDKIPAWSPYRDYAEAIRLLTAKPTAANAAELAPQCEHALGVSPSPYVLARCATVLQLARQPARATYFADGICKLHPRALDVLIESMNYVDADSPEVGQLRSSCVESGQ
jgi:O-antigen ligase